MAELLFYEKPGCFGNRRQKALLASYCIRLKVLDLLTESWTAERLRPFFGNKPVSSWFNQSAPVVKSGELPISSVDEQTALNWMIDDPLLICRPLLDLDGIKQSGFVPGPVLEQLGIELEDERDLQNCPKTELALVCGSGE